MIERERQGKFLRHPEILHTSAGPTPRCRVDFQKWIPVREPSSQLTKFRVAGCISLRASRRGLIPAVVAPLVHGLWAREAL